MKIEDMSVKELLELAGQGLNEADGDAVEMVSFDSDYVEDDEYTTIEVDNGEFAGDAGEDRIEVPAKLMSDIQSAITNLKSVATSNEEQGEFSMDEEDAINMLTRIESHLKTGTRGSIKAAQVTISTGILNTMNDIPASVINFVTSAINLQK